MGKHGQLTASEMLCNFGCHVLGLAVAEFVDDDDDDDDVVVLDDLCLSCLLT
jgi:hypothetical protein